MRPMRWRTRVSCATAQMYPSRSRESIALEGGGDPSRVIAPVTFARGMSTSSVLVPTGITTSVRRMRHPAGKVVPASTR